MCNLIKTVLTLFIFIISSNIFAMQDQEAEAGKNSKPVRIAFFIDDHSERFGLGENQAIAHEFARTLSQSKSSAIIVSNYVLKNMILRKYTKTLDSFLKNLDLDLNDWIIYQVQNTQFFIFVPRDYNNSIFNKDAWTKINLSSGNAYDGDESLSFPKISWADNAPVEAKRLLLNESLKYIPYAKDIKTNIKDFVFPEHKNFEPDQLSLIFTSPTKEVKTITVKHKPFEYELYKLNSLPPCNIYMMGHGRYSSEKKDITITGMSVDNIVNTLLFFNDKLNTKSVRISSCYSGGKNLDLMQVKNDIPIRIKYLLIVDSLTDTSIFRISSEKLKNFNRLDGYFEALDNFQNGYESFNDKIKAIKSDPTKAAILKSEIKKLEKSSGLNEVLQTLAPLEIWYFLPHGPSNFPQIWIPDVGWFQTFNINPDIQKITNATIRKILAKPEIIKEEVEVEDIRKKPPVTKKITITRLKEMDFAAAGTIEINKKLALLLYPEIVSVNLNIIPNAKLNTEDLYKGTLTLWLINTYKYFPSIPCLDTVYNDKPTIRNFYIYPQFISMQRQDSVNLFAKINILDTGETPIETGILNFLRDSFLILRGRKSEKIFFIKELEGFNDFPQILNDNDDFKNFLQSKNISNKQIILNNVFIRTSIKKSQENPFELLTVLSISFEFEGIPWNLYYEPKKLNFETILPLDKSQSLWRFKVDKSTHDEHLKSLNLTHLAELPPTEYYTQLPIIRDLFQHRNTSIKIKNPSSSLSFKDFLLGLTPEDVEKIREWTNYEQQALLKRKIKKLKFTLETFRQKLLMLSLKLQTLQNKLTEID